MATAPEDTRLSDLLIRWEELRELGQDIATEELCASHPELAVELKRRIAALQEMDPLKSGTMLLTMPPTPLDVIGNIPSFPSRSAACTSTYRNLRFHAAGGLGEVFRAYGDDLHRDVALKFIKSRMSHDPESRRRFLQEAEVTGRLEHPGIVPVYSLGRDEEGHPCYAMRFIRGQTLEEAIQAFHGANDVTGPPGRNLALRGLIKRLVAVCNTIAYAHSRGVLHRDIKPRNIMLGKYDETLVVDWGLARPFDRSKDEHASDEETLRPSSGESGSGTPTIGVIGTPAYMSPEQSEGHHDLVGPASDVYSLGATLYAVLTGRSPFAGRNIGEALEKVRRGVIVPPRQLDRTVPRSLEAICIKAMALRIEDRYQAALELAEDLERWLADEPVTAYREPLLARLARWGRRHRTAVAGITALLATSVVAMSVATVLLGRQNEEIQRQKGLAIDAVNRMLTQVGEVELADVPQMEPIRARLLQEARQFYLAFLAQERAGAAIRRETARAHRRLGDIQEMLGDYIAAEQSYRAAIPLFETPAGQAPEVRQDLARCETSLGILLKKSNRYQEAEPMLRAAVERRERLAAESPGNLEFQQALAESRYQWGTLLARLPERSGEDEQAYREALRLQEKLVAAAGDRPEFHRDKGRALNNLGMLLAATGRRDQAEADFREALRIQEAQAQRAPTLAGHRWRLARTECNLGVLLASARRTAEAEELERKALELQKTLVAEYPGVPDYANELVMTYNNLGLLWEAGAPEKAEDAYRDALKLQEALVARFPRMPDYRHRLAITYLNLGGLLAVTDPEEAKRCFDKARGLQDWLVESFPNIPEYRSALGRTLYNLARVRRDRSELAGARRLLEQAISHQRAAWEANRRNPLYRGHLRDSLGVMAEALTRLGDHAKAADAAEEMPRVVPDEPDEYLRAAALLTRCMTLADADRTRSGADRHALEQSYARRATSLLRRAVDRKLLRNPNALDHPDLAPLDDRDDFKAIKQLLKNSTRVGVA